MDSLINTPDGYQITTGPFEDLGELVAMISAYQEKYDGAVTATESFWGAVLADPRSDPKLDVLQIRSSDTSELVGFGRYLNVAPHVESSTQGFVHPDREGSGLGSVIIDWGLERSRAMEGDAPPSTRITNLCFANATNESAHQLFEENGYSLSRYFLEMERALDGTVAVEAFPNDVTVRTMRGVEDIEVIVDPVMEAFRDHYGHTDSTRESEVEQWHRWRGTDEWDDSLVWIVEADGVPVAVNMSVDSLGARTETGYVASLAVLRDWRGQGIARALLTTAFAEFQRRGRREVALHVDADSLTGATRLYEGVGMSEVQRHMDFTYEIRQGTDLVVR